MKSNREINHTDNSRVYKILRGRKLIRLQNSCIYCPPNKGCNSRNITPQRNWKSQRKTQYKLK